MLIASETLYQRIQVLREVFRRIREARLPGSVKIVDLCKNAVNCVLLYISKERAKPPDTKRNPRIYLSVPQDFKTFKTFLALYNYCREFISNQSTSAEPLQKLLRKGSLGSG